MKPIVLKGHSKPIKGLMFNKENDLLFSASTDKQITLWSSQYGERIGTYKHGAAVYSMDIDSESKILISGDSIGSAYVWEASNGELLKKIIVGDVTSVQSINIDRQNECVYIGYSSRRDKETSRINVYKINDLLSARENDKKEINVQPLKQLDLPNKDKLTKTKLCDGGNSVIAASKLGQLYKFDVKDGKLLMQKKVHDDEITDMNLSLGDELLITASKDSKAKVLDPDNFEVLTVLSPENPSRNINACIFSPFIGEEDESKAIYHAFIAGGQESKDVTTTTQKKGGFETLIYDCKYGVELGSFAGHFGPVNSLAITSDGELLATGSEESSVRVHRIMNEEYKNLIKN